MRTRRDEQDERATTKKAAEKLQIAVDILNEQVVIAAACVDKGAADKLLTTLEPERFHGKGHAPIWQALRAMQAKGLYYDPATVAQISGHQVDVAYLEQLVIERPAAPPNLSHHVEALRWDGARVAAATGPLTQLHDALRDVTSSPDLVRSLANKLADAFVGHGTDGSLVTAGQVTRAHAPVMTGRRGGRACFPYGIRGLDVWTEGPDEGTPRMIPGAAPGKVTMLTGVSGSGKSSVACRMALEMAEQGRRVLFGAWEQGKGETLEMMAAMSLGLSRTDLGTGRFSHGDQVLLEQEMERLGEHVMFFDLPFGRARGGKDANDRAIDLIHQVVADSRCEVFVADLIRRVLKETNPDDEEQAAFRLQAMGQQLNVHQLWLHQQRLKDVEGRKDRRPTREGMKGSSAWVEASDTIIGIHRDYLFKSVPDDKIETLVLKQRWGKWPIAVEHEWDPEFVEIANGRTTDFLRAGEMDSIDEFMSHDGGNRRGRR